MMCPLRGTWLFVNSRLRLSRSSVVATTLQKVQGCRKAEGGMHDPVAVGGTEPVFALDDAEFLHEAQR
jgi:hypothetical protein